MHTMERTIKYISSLNILELLISSNVSYMMTCQVINLHVQMPIESTVSIHCAYKSACIVKYTSSKHIVILTKVPMMFNKSSHSCH